MSGVTPERGHLVIDARPLTGGHNGIARVVKMLAERLPEVTDARITALSNRPMVLPRGEKRIEGVEDKAWSRLPGNLWLTARVPALLRTLGATHFLGTQHMLPMMKVPGVRYGVLMHDVVHLKHPASMKWSNRLSSTLLFRRSYNIADNVIAVSRTTRDDLCAELGERSITVAYPGVDNLKMTQAPRAPSNSPPWRLLYVGSLEPRKNLTALLAAFEVMNLKQYQADLVICSGGQWGATGVTERIQSYVGHGQIQLLRNVDDNELQRQYALADALVFPSLYEGFGLPLLEAVGRTSVIANDIPIFREIAANMVGVNFIDFSAGPTSVSAQLVSALQQCVRPQLKTSVSRAMFTWDEFAYQIAQGLNLGRTVIADKNGSS